jgi:hypothetical protein
LLFNTSSSTGGAIRVFDMFTETSPFCATYLPNTSCNAYASGSFNGWLNNDDKVLIGDFKRNKSDIMFINTSYSGGAIRCLDLSNGLSYGYIPYSSQFDYWFDGIDENTICVESIQSKNLHDKEESVNEEFALFPNPTNNIISINSENNLLSLSIFDINGRFLKEINFNQNETKFDLSMKKFNSGIYFLKLRTTNSSIIKKIIKKGHG